MRYLSVIVILAATVVGCANRASDPITPMPKGGGDGLQAVTQAAATIDAPPPPLGRVDILHRRTERNGRWMRNKVAVPELPLGAFMMTLA